MNKLKLALTMFLIRLTASDKHLTKFAAVQVMMGMIVVQGNAKHSSFPWFIDVLGEIVPNMKENRKSLTALNNIRMHHNSRMSIDANDYVRKITSASDSSTVIDIFKEFMRKIEPNNDILTDEDLNFYTSILLSPSTGAKIYAYTLPISAVVLFTLASLVLGVITATVGYYALDITALQASVFVPAMMFLSLTNSFNFATPSSVKITEENLLAGKYRIAFRHTFLTLGVIGNADRMLGFEYISSLINDLAKSDFFGGGNYIVLCDNINTIIKEFHTDSANIFLRTYEVTKETMKNTTIQDLDSTTHAKYVVVLANMDALLEAKGPYFAKSVHTIKTDINKPVNLMDDDISTSPMVVFIDNPFTDLTNSDALKAVADSLKGIEDTPTQAIEE